MSKGLGAHYYRYTEDPLKGGTAMGHNFGSGLGEVSPMMMQQLGALSSQADHQIMGSGMGMGVHPSHIQGQALGGDSTEVAAVLGVKALQNPSLITDMPSDFFEVAKATADGDKEAIKKMSDKYGPQALELYATKVLDEDQSKRFIADFRQQQSGAESSNTMMYFAIGGAAVVGAGALYYFMNRKPEQGME